MEELLTIIKTSEEITSEEIIAALRSENKLLKERIAELERKLGCNYQRTLSTKP
jgi:hypothetical protein